jgi:DNA-binding NarL/FixJ family response regulator
MEPELEQPVRTRWSLDFGEWVRRFVRLPSRRNELVAASGPEIAARSNGTAGLSPRELQVLRLLPRGMTNQQIARELIVSEPTVATHVRHILQKTGAANRAEAAAFAVRHQLD